MSDNEPKITITDMLSNISEEICFKYCKYPDVYRELYGDCDDIEDKLLEHECKECPLNWI